MIDPKELRIGNLVNYYMGAPMSENILTKVEWKDLKNIDSGDKNYEPIPLTLEWLERFGFYQICHNSDWAFINLNPGQLQITTNGRSVCYSKRRQSVNIGAQCSAVHALQNLYHTLTGEELEMEESDE